MRSASVLSFSFYFNGKENSMTKFAILGAAVVFFALAGPAIAQHSVANPSYIVETGVCPGHEPEIPIPSRRITSPGAPGPPRGGWDDHNDLNCLRDSHFCQHQAGF